MSNFPHLEPPEDSKKARRLRRNRVERIICRRGQVCAGGLCPCVGESQIDLLEEIYKELGYTRRAAERMMV